MTNPLACLALVALASTASAKELPTWPKGEKRPANFKELRALLAPQGFDVHRPSIAPPAGLKVLKGITYAKRDTGDLKLDLYLPAGTETPPTLIMLVHGGGWKKGSKDNERTKAHWFTTRGYACAAVSYRLSGVAKFPAARDDLRDAVAWLRSKAADYGYAPDRIAAFGGSAGAHLVALHATATTDPTQQIQAVIPVAGPTETVSARVAERSLDPTNNYHLWMGASMKDRRELYQLASPADHVTAETPPVLLFSENSADNDSRFLTQLEQAGVPHESHVLTAALHPSWNWEPWFTFTMKRCDAFFKRHLPAVSQANANDSAEWKIDTDDDWEKQIETSGGAVVEGGSVSPKEKSATLRTKLHSFDTKRSAKSLTAQQSAIWQNWNPIENLGPSNLSDAPVMLTKGEDDYWMFGRYGGGQPRRKKGEKSQPVAPFKAESATLEGFDIPLKTTRFPNQFDAPGGLKPRLGGYHAWQSRDMKNWVHHGPITERKSAWMTSAEFADGKAYFYYDFPNDQDPHVYVDADLFDGLPGDNKGMAYDDPSHGSDSGIIRDLDGNFHLIVEDWSPINAQRHAWDSPLAAHAVSRDGFSDFKTLAPPVDERTKPTGEIGTYKHPHWVKEHPARFKTNIAEYAIHEPEQNAYGDWAAICLGGQYYLFCDYDPADTKSMSVGWFTSPSLDQQFTWCDNIGKGHPDPDIGFAEGQFYLVTQQKTDYVSPGPWVEKVTARVGVDIDNDSKIDQWTDWAELKESYDYTPGFSKQVAKTPASLDLSGLPEGYGFQLELKIEDTTENKSKPILEGLVVRFD